MLNFAAIALSAALFVPFLGQLPEHLSSWLGTHNDLNIVALDYATFEGEDRNGISVFLGMPYAAPPIGNLRFAAPEPPLHVSTLGVVSAKRYGPGCIPQGVTPPAELGLPSTPTDGDEVSEDCLTMNVFKPSDLAPDAIVPVIFFNHGGGFVLGTTSVTDSGFEVVNRSSMLGSPVVYVSANYRTNAFGFLAGKEVQANGVVNAGLHDNIAALEWVQKYVGAFGGDPNKVTVWGESSGAMSLASLMASSSGIADNLFRGAVLVSGFPILLRDVPSAQKYYDQLVSLSRCEVSPDTLQCLRELPVSDLVKAINKTSTVVDFEGVKLPWQPRVDGVLFTQEPWNALRRVVSSRDQLPFIATTNDDEGTIFSLGALNISTNEEFLEYVEMITGPVESVKEVSRRYAQDPSDGSPFGTSEDWNYAQHYKRISAFIGDWGWQNPRRMLLRHTNGTQKTWSAIYRRGKGLHMFGSMHGASTTASKTDPKGYDYLINFAHNLDPNAAVSHDSRLPIYWPEWKDLPSGALLTYSDPDVLEITEDNFRAEAMDAVYRLSFEVLQPLRDTDGFPSKYL